MQLSHKDKSLLLLIATALVVLWIVFSLFSRFFTSANFGNSDISKLVAEPNQEWLNLSRPLALDDLKDRVILLDFWSYSCVSCVEALPEIKKLEERFGDKLLVIGVHSPLFSNDANRAQIKKAVIKHDVDFPVVNDSQSKIRHAFKVENLPTFLLINLRGSIQDSYVGLDNFDRLKQDIKDLVEYNKSAISREPLPLLSERYNLIGNVLSFPTQIEYAQRFTYKTRTLPVLFIANSSQNNIVVSSLTGEIIVKIGSGKDEFVDGDFESAAFSSPRGMLFDGSKLYVADSGNHALRVIDFKEGKVSTLIGSGTRGQVIESMIEGKEVALNFPSDLEFFPNSNVITIANTGSNQILSYNLKTRVISNLAKGLAQPSNLAVYGGKLYFLDTSSSSLRVLDQNGDVKTLADKSSGLQHPLGLAVDDTGAYIVDSFNNKIRKFDFASKQLRDFAGAKISFDEPEGIVAVLDRFYVVDTNNNRILSVNRGSLSAEILDVMPPLKLPKEGFLEYLPNLQSLLPVEVKEDVEVALKIELAAGWKINESGPSFVNLLELTGEKHADMLASFDWNVIKDKTMKLPKLVAGKEYLLQGTIYYCEDKKNSLCYIKSYEQKITAAGEGLAELKIILGDTDAQK